MEYHILFHWNNSLLYSCDIIIFDTSLLAVANINYATNIKYAEIKVFRIYERT